MQNNQAPAFELAMQELDIQPLEGLDAPDWWTSFVASFAVSASVSAAYSTVSIVTASIVT